MATKKSLHNFPISKLVSEERKLLANLTSQIHQLNLKTQAPKSRKLRRRPVPKQPNPRGWAGQLRSIADSLSHHAVREVHHVLRPQQFPNIPISNPSGNADTQKMVLTFPFSVNSNASGIGIIYFPGTITSDRSCQLASTTTNGTTSLNSITMPTTNSSGWSGPANNAVYNATTISAAQGGSTDSYSYRVNAMHGVCAYTGANQYRAGRIVLITSRDGMDVGGIPEAQAFTLGSAKVIYPNQTPGPYEWHFYPTHSQTRELQNYTQTNAYVGTYPYTASQYYDYQAASQIMGGCNMAIYCDGLPASTTAVIQGTMTVSVEYRAYQIGVLLTPSDNSPQHIGQVNNILQAAQRMNANDPSIPTLVHAQKVMQLPEIHKDQHETVLAQLATSAIGAAPGGAMLNSLAQDPLIQAQASKAATKIGSAFKKFMKK